MKKIYFFLIISSFSLFSTETNPSVVCIHGFLGGKWTMHYLGKNIKREGFDVLNWKYPSTKRSIQSHSHHLVQELRSISENKPNKPIHFVTHSMGALVLLGALNHPNCPKEAKIGKLILISPPLKGSKWGRWLHRFSLIRWLAKDFSGKELMTQENFDYLGEYPHSIQNILVIAGTFGFNPFLKGKNDGTLLLEETFLSTSHERIVVNRGHKTIVFSKKVCGIILDFLSFDKSS